MRLFLSKIKIFLHYIKIMFRVKQTTQPFMENIKNKPIPLLEPPQAMIGAMAAKITVLPMQKQKVTPLMSGIAVNNTTHRQVIPCVKSGINILRTAPVDGLNQQPPIGIARGQQRGFQYNLQLPITHDLCLFQTILT